MKLWVRIITILNKWWLSSLIIMTAFFIVSTVALILHIIGCSVTENCNGDFFGVQTEVSLPFCIAYIFLCLIITFIVYIYDFLKNIKSIFKFDRFTNNFGINEI
jgi:hypothetical protein